MGIVCNMLFDEQHVGVSGYVCLNCDSYFTADTIPYHTDNVPHANRRDGDGDDVELPLHSPYCPTCFSNVTGAWLRMGRTHMKTDFVRPKKCPRKPIRRHKEGDKWVPDEMVFHEEPKYRKKWIPTGRFRYNELGERVPRFRMVSDKELISSNRDKDGNEISNSPMNFWAMLGYVTNKRAHSYTEVMEDHSKAVRLWKRLEAYVDLRALSKFSRAANRLLDLYGNLKIRKDDLRHIVHLGSGLVAIYEGRVFHGPKKGHIKGHKAWYDLDKWTKELDNYNGGELHMDRGALTNAAIKRWILRDIKEYLATGEYNVCDLVSEYANIISSRLRAVCYIDNMDIDGPERSAKPHAE